MADFNHAYIASLVRKAQAGSSDAFAELYGLTYNATYNYANFYLKDSYLAQDAVQDTYISALKNIHSLNDPSLFIAWLKQINFHTCYDMCKKNNASYGLVEPELLEIERDTNVDHNPEDVYEREDEISRLNKAIDELPFLEKQAIVLRYYNDTKIEDIAKMLKISKSTVKRYLNSARDKLKEIGKGDLS